MCLSLVRRRLDSRYVTALFSHFTKVVHPMTEQVECVRIDREGGVARVTIDSPPMNLLGGELLGGLAEAAASLARDKSLRVAIFRSADPDFFIAHGDVEVINTFPRDPAPPAEELPVTHQILENLRRLPQVTIAQIEGFARGGGSEVALALDMRFAALGKAVFGQPEVALGILPGAGGTVRLTRMLGRARASEIILGGDDFSAEEAERCGWINRALPPNELTPFVERLARRIASFPAPALEAAKATIQSISDREIERDLLDEQRAFDRLMQNPESESSERMKRFLDLGIQTREGQTRLAEACEDLAGPR